MTYRADLHIHSVLSPCGSLSSSPGKIVEEALRKELSIIAITDHNSTGNLPALKKAASGKITAFFGMELQTVSETHLLILFDNLDAAMDFGDLVYTTIPDTPNKPDFFGDQIVVDENDNILALEERLLLQSTTLDVEEAVSRANSYGGMVFPAHIDRSSFSIISQLGFIPETLPIDGIEISGGCTLLEAEQRFPEYFRRYPAIRNSDAHYLHEIGNGFTVFDIQAPTFPELKKALHETDGRKHYFDA